MIERQDQVGGADFICHSRLSHRSFVLPVRLFVRYCLCATVSTAVASIYEVGPNRAYPDISSVPWESLVAGDVVRIHWRPAAYAEKWVICRQGTAQNPIVVTGAAGPSGELPVVSGINAVTRTQLDYWNESRSLLKIGGASVPTNTTPKHIVVENLVFESARPPFGFTNANGATGSYDDNASGVYIEKGHHITLRNLTFRNCGNGLFVAAGNGDTREIIVENCRIYDNGIENSIAQHNVYTEALGITFQYNYFGPLRAGCFGNNLKDRSAGLVVRYNWIESGNRQLDLVESGHAPLRDDPLYAETFVYGNVLIEPDGAGNRQIVHYGGDGFSPEHYRKGTLYFYHNTVVSTRKDRTTLFRLSTNDETCDARNNLVYAAAGGETLALVEADGMLAAANNWFSTGYVRRHFGLPPGGDIVETGTVTGASPGFLDMKASNFRISMDSKARNQSTDLHPAALNGHEVVRQYLEHQRSEPRKTRGRVSDIGAYEAVPMLGTMLLFK